MANTWKFVDLPVASPATLLDMNDGVAYRTLGGDDFKLPSPPLKRSIAANAMSDGGVVTSAAYDLRTLTFMVDLLGATDTARITQLDALKAQLAKPTNLVMHQLQTATFPVFFRTLRSDDYVVDTEISTGFWRVSCSILAEPFAIGIRRDLPTVTVVNDPAAASVPMRWDITGIVGDSPTPAFVRIGAALGPGNQVILAQRTVNNPTALTVFAQAESGTLGTDTTVQANDVNMSGPGSNFVRTSFASNSAFVTRLTVTLPTASDAAALRGRYRVYVRTRTSATGSNFTMRFLQNVGATNSVNGPQVSFASLANTEYRHTDLGILEFPGPGPMPASMGYSGLPSQAATQPLGIQIQRNSGSATMDLDYVVLMPADERLSETSRSVLQANSFVVIDGPAEMAYGMPSGTTPFGSTRTVDGGGGLVSLMGSAPMLVPGVTNRWYMFRGGSSVATTSPVDVSYWPRWREVATS